nr:imidazole glycerol phosphate synthase subunit HisH [Halocatena marina]
MCGTVDGFGVNVTIIDYGVGNLRSLQRGLERAGAVVSVSDDPAVISDAESLVLPGVGAFEECMRNSEPFHDVLIEKAADTPILGICVGLQLMFTESTEGAPEGEVVEGLDLLDGRVERLPDSVNVPHMGWNELTAKREHPLVGGITDNVATATSQTDGAVDSVDDPYVYFVHSYCAAVSKQTVASCEYGRKFTAVAANEAGNVMGTQFHPEKSGEAGLRILQNFVTYARSTTNGGQRLPTEH